MYLQLCCLIKCYMCRIICFKVVQLVKCNKLVDSVVLSSNSIRILHEYKHCIASNGLLQQ